MIYNLGLFKFSCKYLFLFLTAPIIDCVKLVMDYMDIENIIMPYSGIPFHFQLAIVTTIILFIMWCYIIDKAFNKINVCD